MKTQTLRACSITLINLLTWSCNLAVADPLGTAFTYQGRLTEPGGPANGLYDIRFAILDGAYGSPVGPVLTNTCAVSNGLFTATLDFGPGVFLDQGRWLDLAVRTNGPGPFIPLWPRQQLTPAPAALYAPTAGTAATANSMSASNLTGTIRDAQLNTNIARLDTNVTFTGNVVFSGGSVGFNPGHIWDPPFLAGSTGIVVNLNADTVDGKHASDFWQLGGNNVNANQEILGTKANANWSPELQLITDGAMALRLTPIAGGTPAVVGGHGANVGNVSGATVGGGGNALSPNTVSASFGTIAGGEGNLEMQTDGTIGGGTGNAIHPGQAAGTSTIGGGSGNLILDDRSVIAGGIGNTIAPGGFEATIGGGSGNTTAGRYSIIAGGKNNNIFDGLHNAIGGGIANQILSNACDATISGGSGNTIADSTESATVGGGMANLIGPTSDYSTIGGGYTNSILSGSTNATIGGGFNNMILDNSKSATIAGGENNAIGTNAWYGTIPGGYSNRVAGNYGLAAGRRALAIHQGAFVWADSTDADFASTANNQFLIRASGGVGINKNNPATALDVNGTVTATSFSGGFNGNGAGVTNVNPGHLSAGTATINISGTAAGFTGSLAGDVIGTQSATAVASVGGRSASDVATGASAAINATSANSPNTIVKRDSSGNFSAGTITASLAGNASSAATANNFSGFLSGDVTGTQSATVVANVGGRSASDVATGASAAINATSANSPSTIVKRDSSGNFSAGTITASLSGNATTATTANNFSGSLSGDVTGPQGATRVSGLQGLPVAATVPASGQVLRFNSSSAQWQPSTDVVSLTGGGGVSVNAASGNVTLNTAAGGDLSGPLAAATVTRLQNQPLSSATPAAANVLRFDGIQWQPSTDVSSLTAGPGLTSSGGQNPTLSLDTTHSNTWTVQQTFQGGVRATNYASHALRGDSGGNIAVLGINGGAASDVGGSGGVYGLSGTGFGVAGESSSGDGVLGASSSGYAGHFIGTLKAEGLISSDAGVLLNGATSSLYCGSTTRQMLNLFTNAVATYGIGVQSSTLYFRTGGDVAGNGFAWYRGGVHNDGQNNNGGGTTLMTLNNSGLTVNGTFVSASDRSLKENFADIDTRSVLEKVVSLPVRQWNYKQDKLENHIGPMAQDFYAAFKVGPDDKHIATIDESGVALAAIQGLNQKVEEQLKAKDAEIQAQSTEIQDLKQSVAELKALVEKLAGK